jgi:hypothetical protein
MSLETIRKTGFKKIITIILTLALSAYLFYLLISINSHLMISDPGGKYERQSTILLITCAVLIGSDIRRAFTKPGDDSTDPKAPDTIGEKAEPQVSENDQTPAL